MGTAISTLVLYLRMVADDNDISLQEFSDGELINYLRLGVIMQEASWDQGYSVISGDSGYEITPSPSDWLQILYVLKTALGMKVFQERFSYDNGVIRVTNNTKSNDIKDLRLLYDEIIQERKNGSVGYAFSSFDDFFTRPNLTMTELEEGYR